MAYEQGPMILHSMPTATDLSAHQYRFVKLSAGLVVACSGATDIPIGVLQNKPVGTATQSALATVCMLGITKIAADAQLAQDAWIGPSADGQADAKTIGGDATEFICGRMLAAASGAGAVSTAAINCITPHNAVTAN
jgi:hypothetical protein